MNLDFPIKYFEENIIYNNENEAWAYYGVRPFNYGFLSQDEMMRVFTRQKALFWQLNMDGHLLILNEKQSVVEMGESFKKTLDGELKDVATKHTDDTTDALINLYGDDSYKYTFYIGVKLKKRSDSFGLLKTISKAFKEFMDGLNEISGMDVLRIDKSDYEKYKRSSKASYQKIANRLQIDALTTAETQKLIERNFKLGMTDIKDKQVLKPKLVKGESVVSTDGKDVLRLSECYINNEISGCLELRNAGRNSFVSYLTVGSFPFEDWAIGSEWMYYAQSFDFPVDMSVRMQTIGNKKATKITIDKKKEIKDQRDHIEETGNSAGINIYDANDQVEQLEADLTTTRMPLLKTTVTFCVYADEKDELERRVDLLRDGYSDLQMQLEQPVSDQFLLFNEFLPAGDRYVQDYFHYVEPAKIASGAFGATQKVGDVDGFFIGTQGANNDYVWLNVTKAAQTVRGKKTSSLSASFTGSTGSGKSFNANNILYSSVLGGARGLVFDPKNERSDWKEKLYDISEHINIITLGGNDEDKGKLDPWQVAKGSEATSLAISVASKLCAVNSKDEIRFPLISEAVYEVDKQEKPCMRKVISYLVNSDDEQSKRIGKHLNSFAKLSFGSLLFGDGESNQVDLTLALNVLQVRGLKLPKRGKKPEKYDLLEELSLAMMSPISVLSKSFLYSDRSIFKIFLCDEAWAFMRTEEGLQLFDEIVREGRAMNAGLFIATQNVGDLEDVGFRNNMGMKFAFRCTDDDEIEKVLSYFGLKSTKENIETMQNLEDGQCLFKDIYGNVGVVQFRCLFRDLYEAFDTRPPEGKEVA